MAHHDPFARQPGTVLLVGSFTTDGAGAVTSTVRGKGFTVSKIAATTGRYRVTFTADGTRKYPRILGAVFGVMKSGDVFIKTHAISDANGQADCEVISAGTPADLVSGEIHFCVAVQNTGSAT
jgi:hypothetical protein